MAGRARYGPCAERNGNSGKREDNQVLGRIFEPFGCAIESEETQAVPVPRDTASARALHPCYVGSLSPGSANAAHSSLGSARDRRGMFHGVP